MSSDICLELVDTVRYSREQSAASDTEEERSGVLQRSGLAWYARGSVLEVFNINSSFKVISQNFSGCTSKSKPCTIECVEELDALHCKLLAVGLRVGVEQTHIVLLSLKGCREVGRIDVQEDVKIIRFIDASSCSIGLLSGFSGCIAVGTVDGKVIMVDLCLKVVQNGHFGREIAMNDESKSKCHIEFNHGDPQQMVRNHAKVKDRGMYFGLQWSHDVHASVESILDIVPLKATCVGFDDGTILILDLVDQSIMHRICPPTEDCAVIAMNFVEPSDDPKAYLYLWGFYAHADGAFAFLYMIMCEEKYIQQGASVYDKFLSCSTRLSLSSYDPGSVPLHVQSVTKKVSREDEPITLSVLSWMGSDRTTTVIVFDLNQWYKAEMPYECDWQDELTHIVVFKLQESSFHAQLNERSLVLFRSIQRPEEHFYPSSLAFDIMNFNGFNRTMYRWVGLQNKLLQYLDQDGANSVIEPSDLFQMLCRAALLPQFCELSPCADDSVKTQREFILSLGLEYNCRTFLQSCVDLWADGSHLGADPEQGVSLSTLTDWIWNRSAALKSVCNRMLAPLLDSVGRRVDARTQDELSRCTRQMKQLAALYRTILADCVEIIPENVLGRLSKESDSISAAAEYQDILQWLLHIGVLPEVHESFANSSDEEQDEKRSADDSLLVPYPYTKLFKFYRDQRDALDGDSMDAPSRSKLLFIDNLIEREFEEESIRKAWLDDADGAEGAPLYPPESLQKALRVLLIPEASMERKLVLLLYFFMDIIAVLGDGRYRNILQQLEKFPRMFNLKLGVMRRVQAFWHLDHGNVVNMVEEFLSPLSSTIDFPQWHRELAVSVLLQLDAAHLALKVLRAQGCPVTPQLELYTLVHNNLIAEAFSLQRRTPQPDGQQLVWFVEAILKVGKPETLLEFSLTEEEKLVLRSYLRESPLPESDSLMLGHLLQNCEFVEAVHLVDRLARRRNNGMETQRDILSLYHKALDPTSQRLAHLTYSEPKELESKVDGSSGSLSPTGKSNVDTLSSALIRNRAEFRVRILHHSIVAIKEAAAITGLHHERPFLEKPGLGVFQCRPMVRSCNVSYPVKLDPSMNKRRLRECDDSLESIYTDQRHQRSPLLNEDDGYGNPRKRRFLGPDRAGVGPVGFGRQYKHFDAPVPVIPEFRPMKPKFNFTAAGSDISPIESGERMEKSTSHSPSIFLTTPPMAKKGAKSTNDSRFHSSASDINESYTPPGILKLSYSGHSIATTQNDHTVQIEGEEKVLRFDLPTGADLDSTCFEERDTTLDATNEAEPVENPSTPRFVVDRRDLDLSAISNDDFYSPEVTVENSGLQQLLFSAGPARRPPLHRSRSATPTGSLDGSSNIAIIIEDHVEDECLSSQMDVEEGTDPAEEQSIAPEDCNVIHKLDLIGEEAENAPVASETDEVVMLEEVATESAEVPKVIMDESIKTTTTASEEGYAKQDFVPQSEQQHSEDDVAEEAPIEVPDEDDIHEVVDVDEDYEKIFLDEEEAEEEEEVEEGGAEEDDFGDEFDDEDDYDEDEEEDLQNGELDNSGEENVNSNDSSSVVEVIDLSDEALSYSSSSSSSSSDPGDGGSEQVAAQPIDSVTNEPTGQPAENAENAENALPQMRCDEFYSESLPKEVFDLEENDEGNEGDGEDEEEQAAPPVDDNDTEEHQGEEPIVASSAGGMDYIQVPTTSSSTHRTGGQEIVNSSDESSEVEDLSVQLQDAAELADSSVASAGTRAIRDLSVAGEQWEDGVASTSGYEEVVRVTPSASGATTPTAGTATVVVTAGAVVAATAATAVSTAVSSPTQPQPPETFAQPKNAHELEVPAMNLSVKPDEAHGSSRKNSKGEENGLTEEARALNLSAGQQELADQLGVESDNVSSNNENDDADVDNEAQSSDEAKTEEPSESKDEESMEGRDSQPHLPDEAIVEVKPEPMEEVTLETALEARGNEPNAMDEVNVVENLMPIQERRISETGHVEEIVLLVSDEEDELQDTQPMTAEPATTPEQCVVVPEVKQTVEKLPAMPLEVEQKSVVANEAVEGEPQADAQKDKEAETDRKQALKRPLDVLLQQEEEASTSSPRPNVKTRLMAAMEKSSGNAPASIGTPTRRRSTRATSVVQDNPIDPTLSRSRQYASMDNVSAGTPDPSLPLTPRRSTRASSMARELFANSTPLKRQRRESQSSVGSADQRASVPNSPTEMEPPEPSEKSFASSTASSTQRAKRGKPRKVQPVAQPSDSQAFTGGVPLLSDYSSNRRLTRHQLAVMERSMETIAANSSGRRSAMERQSRASETGDAGAGGDSDSESIISNVSNQSSLRSTRSRTARDATRRSSVETRSNRGGSKKDSSISAGAPQQTADASVVDSDSDISMVSGSQRITHGLEPIAEEGEPNTESTRKRRGRKPKAGN